MTLDGLILELGARFEKAIRQAQSPQEVVDLRMLVGEGIELFRTIGKRALQQEDALKALGDDRRYREAIQTAGTPSAPWPPDLDRVRVVKLQPGERA